MTVLFLCTRNTPPLLKRVLSDLSALFPSTVDLTHDGSSVIEVMDMYDAEFVFYIQHTKKATFLWTGDGKKSTKYSVLGYSPIRSFRSTANFRKHMTRVFFHEVKDSVLKKMFKSSEVFNNVLAIIQEEGTHLRNYVVNEKKEIEEVGPSMELLLLRECKGFMKD